MEKQEPFGGRRATRNGDETMDDKVLYLITFVLMFFACVFSGLALWLIFGGV